MNIERLKAAEAYFLNAYPGGFQNPEIAEIGKKHRVSLRTEQSHEWFHEDAFSDPVIVTQHMAKMISSSSMTSVFEKPRYRDFVKELVPNERALLAESLFEQLHGDQDKGFEDMVQLLKRYKLAKWTYMTVIPAYYRPSKEYFVKPTTTKMIIERMGLKQIYRPQPTWDFYQAYRRELNKMKKHVDKSLSPNGPAFTGFLMMSLSQVD